MSKESTGKKAKKAFLNKASITAITAVLFVALISIFIIIFYLNRTPEAKFKTIARKGEKTIVPVVSVKSQVLPADAWKAPDENTIPADTKYGQMIRYGKELIAHTGKYFGPKGSIARITNGMNCQNCHLNAGTKPFGNSFAIFISSFPKKSSRSGRVESASARIAECFNRSLAGAMPDESGKEVQAMLAYMKWVGKGVKKGIR